MDIPTFNIINKLRDEGFQPFFACQSRVCESGRREFSKLMFSSIAKEVLAGNKFRKLFR